MSRRSVPSGGDRALAFDRRAGKTFFLPPVGNITSTGKRKVLPLDDVSPVHEVHGPSSPTRSSSSWPERIESYPGVILPRGKISNYTGRYDCRSSVGVLMAKRTL
jgi:hypothetical protein